jgi:hypothetical protein
LTTLFEDPAAGVPEGDVMTFELIHAYAAELLADPPIKAVSLENAAREAEARKYAAKDVLRFLRAAEAAGYTLVKSITLERKQ